MYKFLIIYILLLAGGIRISLPFFGKLIQLADLFFIFVLASLVWSVKKNRRIELFNPPPIIRNSIITLLSVLLISVIFSPNSIRSLLEFATIAYLLTLYLWIGGINMDQGRLRLVLHFWLYVSAALCILALAGFASYTFFGKYNIFIQEYPELKSIIPFVRVISTFRTINMFASFLHVGIVFLAALIIYEGFRKRYIFLAILMFACLFLTASRNLLGIFITIFLATTLPAKEALRVSLFKCIIFGLIVLLICLVIITTIWCVFPVNTNYDKKDHTFSVSINAIPSVYAILNRMSVRFIKQSFFTGVGPGMFNQKLVEQINWDEAKDTYKAKGFKDKNVPYDPHNTYLGWAAEAGVAFAAVMIVMFSSIAYFLWKGYRISPDTFTGGLCYICLCGLIGFLINAFYIDILTMRHFWVMMGLGTLAAGVAKQK